MTNDNFFSVDRLVEFGLGMAVAQQMVNSMNHALQNTYTPGAQSPMQQNRIPVSFFAVLDDKRAGPFTESELSRIVSEGKINKKTLLWHAGMPNWVEAENMPDFLRIIALTPPPLPISAPADKNG